MQDRRIDCCFRSTNEIEVPVSGQIRNAVSGRSLAIKSIASRTLFISLPTAIVVLRTFKSLIEKSWGRTVLAEQDYIEGFENSHPTRKKFLTPSSWWKLAFCPVVTRPVVTLSTSCSNASGSNFYH